MQSLLRVFKSNGGVVRASSHQACTRLLASKVVVDSRRFDHPFVSKPKLENQFDDDLVLTRILSRYIPREHQEYVFDDLKKWGDRVVTDVFELGEEAELNPPYLRQMNAWGERQDVIVTAEAWKKLKQVSAEEGLISIGYERKTGSSSRLHQYAKLYLASSSFGMYNCPLAMSDGCASLIERSQAREGDEKHIRDSYAYLREKALPRLTSRDPSLFWTSGQWMTERDGGSDVGGSITTKAVPYSIIGEDKEVATHALYGLKWFSSATDSDITMTLARPVSADTVVEGDVIDVSDLEVDQGSRGLSLFALFVKKEEEGDLDSAKLVDDRQLNGIKIQKLKNKLGTRQLPTAELILEGAEAMVLSEKGRGVPEIAPLINITRLHNSISACAVQRRMLAIARSFGKDRQAFGRHLLDHPLHCRTLATMEVEYRASMHLTFDAVRLFGKADVGEATAEEKALLRLLTPVAKLWTGKAAVFIASEGLEAVGGNGYIEDSGIPKHLRDAQVLPIWEGTTNILSLDVLRVFQKTPEAFPALFKGVEDTLYRAASRDAVAALSSVEKDLLQLCTARLVSLSKLVKREGTNFQKMMKSQSAFCIEARARTVAFRIARLHSAKLLLDHALHTADDLDFEVARRVIMMGKEGPSTTFDAPLLDDGLTQVSNDRRLARAQPSVMV